MPYFFVPSAAFAARVGKLCKNPVGAALFAASAFILAPVYEPVRANVAHSIQTPAAQRNSCQKTDAAESGHRYPRVIDHLLERGSGDRNAIIHIRYPAFGNASIDVDIKGWVSNIADMFADSLDSCVIPGENESEIDQLIASVLNGDSYPASEQKNCELWGQYTITRPSSAAVSVNFELWNYMGSHEGTQDILTLNYSLITGQRLSFVDIFEKPDVALQLMSAWAREKLAAQAGSAMRMRMLENGTEPLIENFSNFNLMPDGICINFQPWQVAPSEAGIQKLKMPLEALMPSEPLLSLWGKEKRDNEYAGID